MNPMIHFSFDIGPIISFTGCFWNTEIEINGKLQIVNCLIIFDYETSYFNCNFVFNWYK